MTTVIINPMSGASGGTVEVRGRERRARAMNVLEETRLPYRIEVTTAPGHGAAIAREALATGATLVCAWGGDGTMNEIASVLAFSTVPLGILPDGSGNGLAREFGVPLRPALALRKALTGVDRVIDAGEIDGRLFFNVAGLGFDAHVARLFNERGTRRGFRAYVTTSFVELFRYQPHAYSIAIGGDGKNGNGQGHIVQRDALIVAIANAAQYGNGARIAPQAKPDDGRLDLVLVESRSPVANVFRARHLFDGRLAETPGVTVRTIEQAEIATPDVPFWFHVDGEPVEARAQGPVKVRVHPRALRLRVPAA